MRAIIAYSLDNGSLVNILFHSIYDKILVDHKFTHMSLLCIDLLAIASFKERITLAVEMGVPSLVAHHFIESLVLNYRSTYHGVLGRPALKEL